jgi:hypothetical protein
MTPLNSQRVIAPDDPEAAMRSALDACLATAETWLGWSGQARVGIGSVWTPHKVLRRITDHFIDHLAQVEAFVAGLPASDVTWQGRMTTFDSDWARFTEGDLREARARLGRLAEIYLLRLRALGPVEYDRARAGEWTVRQITEHLIEAIGEYTAEAPVVQTERTNVTAPRG